MNQSDRLGGFEELVLLAVAALDGDGYGVTLQERLEIETGSSIAVGAVYATLDRLERKGLVASRVGGATKARGGRRKRFFRITAAGRAALRDLRRVRASLYQLANLPGPA